MGQPFSRRLLLGGLGATALSARTVSPKVAEAGWQDGAPAEATNFIGAHYLHGFDLPEVLEG